MNPLNTSTTQVKLCCEPTIFKLQPLSSELPLVSCISRTTEAMDQDAITPAPALGAPAGAGQKPVGGTLKFEDFTLEPLSSEEAHANPETTKFPFTVAHLQRLVAARHHGALAAFSGIDGLAAGLRTDLYSGLGADEDVLPFRETAALGNSQPAGSDSQIPPRAPGASARASIDNGVPGKFTTRRACFGENRVPRRKPKSFLELLWLAFNDKLMFLLTGSAAVSLALGIYQTVQHTDGGPRIEWVEGVAILVAVIVIVFATALNDLQKNYKFQKLNQKKEERIVTVVRSGANRTVSIFDLFVGDLLRVEAGDVVPADAIVISSSELQCDESSLTGESDLVEKVPATQDHGDHLLLSGTRVVAGVGTALVVAVGVNSTYGRVIMSLDDDVQETPL